MIHFILLIVFTGAYLCARDPFLGRQSGSRGILIEEVFTENLEGICDSNRNWLLDLFREIPFNKSPVQVIYLGILAWLKPYHNDLKRMDYYEEYDRAPNIGLWSTTFTMLDDLKEQRYAESKRLTPAQKILVGNLWSALEPYHEMMENAIKSKYYPCGDLLMDLIACESKLEAQDEECSTALLSEMKKRKAMLLENIHLQAPLYLDPRFNNCSSSILTEEQKSTAVSVLLQVHEKMNEVEQAAEEEEEEEYREMSAESEIESVSDDEWETDDIFTSDDLKKLLRELEAQPKPGPGFQIKEHWQEQSDPRLVELANVVLAYPVSIIPVRSDFEFESKMLTSNAEEDWKTLMKMYLGYTADM